MYSCTRVPRTIVTNPLAVPNNSTKSHGPTLPSTPASSSIDSGSTASTTRPSERGPTQTTTAIACASGRRSAAGAGMMCAYSAAVTKACRATHNVKSQNARSRTAWRSVAPSATSFTTLRGRVARVRAPVQEASGGIIRSELVTTGTEQNGTVVLKTLKKT